MARRVWLLVAALLTLCCVHDINGQTLPVLQDHSIDSAYPTMSGPTITVLVGGTFPADGTLQRSVTEHISWTGFVNAVASGISLEKTAGCDGCRDSRARSVQQIPSGDGYVEFRAPSSGLIAGLTHSSSANIDFALSVKPGTCSAVYEDGVWSADSFPRIGGYNDVYRISVVGERVQYSLNGTVFYASAKIPTYPLFVAADLMGLSSSVNNALIKHITSTLPLLATTPPSGSAFSARAYAIPVPVSTGTPDPTLLPIATTTQVPLTAAYNALNVPALPAGNSYLDPLTGAKVYKVTSSVFPTTGSSWGHDYAEGGDEVSLPLNSSGTRAIHVHAGDGSQWLVDFTPGVGVSNPRNLSTSAFPPLMDLCVTFSNNSATPYYMYVSQGATIRRIDLRTMTEAPGGGWPVTGETDAMWLHQSENDAFFTWMRGANGSTVVGYEPASGIRKTYTNSGLNEPRIDRDANNRFICITMGTPQNQAIFWDWQNNVIAWSSPAVSYGGEPPVAHQASMRGYWIGVDWNLSYPWQFFKISATPNSVVNPLSGGPAQGGGHCDGNWIQHPTNADDQWYACYYYGALMPASSDVALAPGGILLSTASGQRRVLAHLYNTSTNYSYYSFAKLSSDGSYVLFTSDMDGSARSDLFLAEMPNSGTPPIDTTPPTVAITAPAAGATVSASVTVSANASDNVGVVGVQFLLDGATLAAEDTSAPYSVSWNTTTSINGSHTLTAVARDAAGNRTTSAAIQVTVANPDTTPPTVAITAPAAGATVSATVTVSANASDNVGVAGVQFYLDGATLGSEDTSTPYSVSWNTTTSINGSHTLTAIARDAAGNRTTSAPVSVTVANSIPDTTPPTVPTSLTATAMSSSQINLSWAASTDTQSGVAGYKIYRGGTQIGTSVSTSYSDTGLSPSTAYIYTVSAYDVAGNTSAQSASVSATTQASGGNIALLHLDENAGSTLFADASGAGNSGSCVGTGCPTAGVAGKVGKALSFDGVSNVVSITHNSGLNAFPLTVAAWFKTNSTAGVVGLVNKYVGGSYNGYDVFLNNGNVCAWYIKDGSNYVYDGSGCTFNIAGYNDNAWHQVVYVVDSSGGKLYLDGLQKGTSRAWTGVAGSPTTTQDIQLGHYPGAFGGVEYFQGLLDEIRIYNTALSASDVSALFTADNAPPPDTTPPTVAITAPAAGATVSGTVTVSANASDNIGVVGVQFYLDGATLGSEDTSAPYSISWNTTTSINGSHTLTAVARDAAGNHTTSAAIQATVANSTVAPSLNAAVTSPVSGATVSGTLQVDATAWAGTVGVRFYVDGNQIGLEDNFAPFSVSWDTTTTPDGSHKLTAVARDLVGNVITSAPVTVQVYNTTIRRRSSPRR